MINFDNLNTSLLNKSITLQKKSNWHQFFERYFKNKNGVYIFYP